MCVCVLDIFEKIKMTLVEKYCDIFICDKICDILVLITKCIQPPVYFL